MHIKGERRMKAWHVGGLIGLILAVPLVVHNTIGICQSYGGCSPFYSLLYNVLFWLIFIGYFSVFFILGSILGKIISWIIGKMKSRKK